MDVEISLRVSGATRRLVVPAIREWAQLAQAQAHEPRSADRELGQAPR
jgi:hypothetical protein